MKCISKSILFLLFLVSGINLFAQRTLIDVSLQPSEILIGQQAVLSLTVTSDPDRPVQIVLPVDTLMRGIEVLAYSPVDSAIIENNRLVIKQDILITSFDSLLYLLPPIQVIDGTDTIASQQVALKVSTVPVDVENPENFHDIKDVWKPPFVLADYLPDRMLVMGVLLVIFLICVVGYIIQRKRNQQPLIPVRTEPLLPPHEQAVKELNELKKLKLWQQGRHKEYYTQLTDTLRRYIEERFGTNAMEMTSSEILDVMRYETEYKAAQDNLAQILRLADLVKFAKLHPLPDENDLSMVNAYLFVNQTKIEEVPKPEEEEKPEEGEDEVEGTNNSKED
ncbi:hypothetical protein LJC54_07660 [Parabacteroides sp. OttesenSCG-928-J18]|nr:hypothetical protein [Parabacteroides sp. OttesenSCG-928-J18]